MPDLSEVQRELDNANNRYDTLAQQIASILKDQQAMLDCIQDVIELLARLDERRQSIPSVHPVPIIEAEVRDKLKQMTAYQKDLLANEGGIGSVKGKSQQLLKGREHAPQTKMLRRQQRKLGISIILLF